MQILQINSNGVISLDRSFTSSRVSSLPVRGTFESSRIIAPYWANVDTRGTGNIYYRQTTDPNLLSRTIREIRRAFPRAVHLTNLLIVTWDAVGYFNQQIDKVRKYLQTTVQYRDGECVVRIQRKTAENDYGTDEF